MRTATENTPARAEMTATAFAFFIVVASTLVGLIWFPL